MLGVLTSPMDIVPTGVSQPTSMNSGVFRQAIIQAKPQGRVGSCFNANALAGGGDGGGDGAFDKQSDGFIRIVQVSCQAIPLTFGIVDGWGISLAAKHWLGWVYYFFPPGKLWSFLLWHCLQYRLCLRDISSTRDIGSSSDVSGGRNQGTVFFFFRERHSPKNLLFSERQIEFDFLPQFQDALHQKAPLISLWWVVLFSEMLQGSGICNCLLPRNLPNVSACIDRHDQRHKPLAVETWQCQGCPERGLLGF